MARDAMWTFTLDQVIKVGGALLAVAALYFGQKAQTDAVLAQVTALAAAQGVQAQKMAEIERTVQETYYTLKGKGVMP